MKALKLFGTLGVLQRPRRAGTAVGGWTHSFSRPLSNTMRPHLCRAPSVNQ